MDDLFDSDDPMTQGRLRVPAPGLPMFFAILPGREHRDAVAQWQRALCRAQGAHIVPRPRDVLHISVLALGAVGRIRRPFKDAIAEAHRQFSFPAFALRFDAIDYFAADGRACVAVADSASQAHVNALRIAIADAMRYVGLRLSRSASHRAHMTLGYGVAAATSRQQIAPSGFPAEEVVLVLSDVGNSRYVRLSRWPLGAA